MDLIIDFISQNPIQIIAAIITFLWVYFEIKASMWMFPIGVILPLIWIFLSWQSRFYGNIIVNAYYLITTIIGWVMWVRHPKQSEDGGIKTLDMKVLLWSLLAISIVSVPVYGMLSDCFGWFGLAPDQTSSLPWADTISTLISFVGMVWLALKIKEQWLCWFIANILSAIVFFHANDPVSGFIFLVNVILSIVGYLQWIKFQKEEQKALKNNY